MNHSPVLLFSHFFVPCQWAYCCGDGQAFVEVFVRFSLTCDWRSLRWWIYVFRRGISFQITGFMGCWGSFLALLSFQGWFNESTFYLSYGLLFKCRKVDPPWLTGYGMYVLVYDFQFVLATLGDYCRGKKIFGTTGFWIVCPVARSAPAWRIQFIDSICMFCF